MGSLTDNNCAQLHASDCATQTHCPCGPSVYSTPSAERDRKLAEVALMQRLVEELEEVARHMAAALDDLIGQAEETGTPCDAERYALQRHEQWQHNWNTFKGVNHDN